MRGVVGVLFVLGSILLVASYLFTDGGAGALSSNPKGFWLVILVGFSLNLFAYLLLIKNGRSSK